jgi:hypothetical protein
MSHDMNIMPKLNLQEGHHKVEKALAHLTELVITSNESDPVTTKTRWDPSKDSTSRSPESTMTGKGYCYDSHSHSCARTERRCLCSGVCLSVASSYLPLCQKHR